MDRLRQKGLGQSAPAQTDMRRLGISLTDAGVSLTAEAVVTAHQISAETVNNLTPREVDRLLGLARETLGF